MTKSLFSFLLFLSLFPVFSLRAQTGWQWGRCSVNYGPLYNAIEAVAVTTDRAGHTYSATAGVFLDSASFGSITVHNPMLAGQQLIIVKTDLLGNYIWVKSTQISDAGPTDIICDTSGNIYIAGSYAASVLDFDTVTLTNPHLYTPCYFLLKINPEGHALWAKNIVIPTITPTPIYVSLALDGAQNIYYYGNFSAESITSGTTTLHNMDTASMACDLFLVKVDPSGNIHWAKSYGSTGNDMQYGITVTPGNRIYITGTYMNDSIVIGTATLTDFASSFYAEIDTNGNTIWAKSFPSGLNATGVTTDGSENLYICGNLYGGILWGPITIIPVGGDDVFIAKTDSAGNPIWAKCGGGTNEEFAFNISADHCGNLSFCGMLGSIPSPGYSATFGSHTIVSPPDGYDASFIAMYDTSGNCLSAVAIGSGADDAFKVQADYHGGLIISSDYVRAPLYLGPDTLVMDTTSERFFIGRLLYDTVLCSSQTPLAQNTIENAPVKELEIFPNPASSECTIASEKPFPQGSSAVFYDVTGRPVSSCTLSGDRTVFSLAELPPGMYQCRINRPDLNVVVRKVVVIR